MSDENAVWYFAYGSNLDLQRFESRVGRWIARRRAELHGFRLRFSADVHSEGGGGAVIVADPDPGQRVYGAIFQITEEQLAAMDREEFDPGRDPTGHGRRLQVVVDADGEPITAEVYTIDPATGFTPPSNAYLGHVLRGLRAVGHGPEIVAAVRAIAAAGG